MATISATNQDKLRDGFAPLLEGFKVVEFDDLGAALAAVDENTAGFLVEPIQGEGGIRPASKEFIAGLRKACDENDLMLVFDEVQCGVARTGYLYAHDLFVGVNALDYSGYPDCRPDFIAAFEALANKATREGVEGRGFARSATRRT